MNSPNLHRMLFAGTHVGGNPRVLYRNHERSTWVVADSYDSLGFDTDDRGPMVIDDAGDDTAALQQFAAPVLEFFDADDPESVDESTEALLGMTVELFDLLLPTSNDGMSADHVKMLEHVQSGERGTPMRPERAIRELTTDRGPEDRPGAPVVDARNLDNLNTDPIDLAGGRYFPRSLYGSTDVEFLRTMRGQANIRLTGPPGTGKTTLVAAAFGDDVITVQGHKDLTPSSLFGSYLPEGNEWVWFDGPATRAATEGKVLLIDEANRAPSDIDAALLSLTDTRRQIVLHDRPDRAPVTAHPNFMVIVTYNDVDTGIRALSASLLRRLDVAVRVETDYRVAAAEGVRNELILVAENLRTSGRYFAANHQSPPSWYPQMADLLAAQRMEQYGPQAMFSSLTASCTDSARRREAVDVFTSVFAYQVAGESELGEAWL